MRTERIRQEQDQGVLPELEWNIEDLERYDTVYIGTCLWNGELPPAVKAFLTKTELEGKTVIPFGAAGAADRKETELTGVLFHNKISEELAERLPLEVSLYEPADFAKAFNLEKALAEPDSRTRMLELGGGLPTGRRVLP